MRQVKFGKSGLEISELGFGGIPIIRLDIGTAVKILRLFLPYLQLLRFRGAISLALESELGGYSIVERLAIGGMAEVWLAVGPIRCSRRGIASR